jgi:hypothetical protein
MDGYMLGYAVEQPQLVFPLTDTFTLKGKPVDYGIVRAD